jgi:4-diphosphocytidyl-2-C-methyl-D-erythritol kinase
MAILRLAAPAKLNLYLHVIGRRPDGYHLLDSLVAFADIQDTLTISSAPRLTFSADGPFAGGLGNSDSNLVVRAARLLADATGNDASIALHLTKRLPVASGIGGGSADAAACLRGLAELWGIDPNGAEVRRVAASLGADIPACVDGRVGFMGGIGTDMADAPGLPPAWVVLVNPGISLPTPDVYRARSGVFSQPMRFGEAPSDTADLALLLSFRRNDLTKAAIELAPAIRGVLDAIGLTANCLLARMSGSGATCFGLFAAETDARDAGTALAHANSGWWVAVGALVNDTRSLASA